MVKQMEGARSQFQSIGL